MSITVGLRFAHPDVVASDEVHEQQIPVNLSTGWLLPRLCAVVAFLLAADVAGLVSRYAFGHGQLFGLIPLFDLWDEANVPTLASTLLIFLNAGLLFVVSDLERRAGRPTGAWRLLAFVFCFLGCDESAQIHEKIGEILAVWHFSGPLYFAWIIPYSLATAALGFVLLPVLRRMQPRVRMWMLLAGAVYVAGAVGFEALEGMRQTATGVARDLGMDLLVAAEETLEMLGQVILVYPLLQLIRSHHRRWVVSVDQSAEVTYASAKRRPGLVKLGTSSRTPL